VAPGGFGKTTLCMGESVAMATARTLLGEQPAERLHVWYHNGEDNLEELQRRLGAICLHYGTGLCATRG
jgi:RecA-family ATPase